MSLMNLYQINFEHYSESDSKEGIVTYLLAKSDEQVYEWIDSNKNHGLYKDNEIDNNFLCEIPFRQSILESKGCMYNEDYLDEHCVDLYYGATFYGWKKIVADVAENEIGTIQNLNISLDSVR